MRKKLIKQHSFFYFACLSVMFFMIFKAECKASCIDVESAQMENASFGESEQDLSVSIPSDMKQLYQENYVNDIISYLENDKRMSEIDTEEIWNLILQGDVLEVGKICFENIQNLFLKEISEGKNLFITLFLLSVISALFNTITDVLENKQTAEMGYYFLYFLMMLVLGRNFFTLYEQSAEMINTITEFVKILLPAYAAAIGLSGNTSYALAYYELILLAIFCVENLLLKIIMPAIEIYVLLILVAGIWKEDRLKLLLNTLKKGIEISLKLFLWVLSSMGVLQSMITPAIESLRLNGVKKMISVIPGVGAMSEGISDIFLGSAILIKNGMGVFITAILLIICLAPLVKMLVYTMMVKCAGALGSIVNHSGLMSITNQIADAGFLLWRAVFTALGLFLMSIAVSILAVRGAI